MVTAARASKPIAIDLQALIIHNGQMINRTFGRLLVTSQSDRPRHWDCLCACGVVKVVRDDHLRGGKVKSCGCLSSETTSLRNAASAKHRMCSTPTYKSWQSMRTRCLNKNADQYPDYGARGITICERWNSFENFLEDMGHRPDGTTIDRIENDKGYEKSNCQWSTMREQENNKRSNVYLEFNGRSMTAAQWSRETGIGYQTIRKRMDAGWSSERTLTVPASTASRACLTVPATARPVQSTPTAL